jgi:hypothetical protein
MPSRDNLINLKDNENACLACFRYPICAFSRWLVTGILRIAIAFDAEAVGVDIIQDAVTVVLYTIWAFTHPS